MKSLVFSAVTQIEQQTQWYGDDNLMMPHTSAYCASLITNLNYPIWNYWSCCILLYLHIQFYNIISENGPCMISIMDFVHLDLTLWNLQPMSGISTSTTTLWEKNPVLEYSNMLNSLIFCVPVNQDVVYITLFFQLL